MFLDSHHTIHSWLELLGIVLAFLDFHQKKIVQSLDNYWHGVTDFTSFDKHLEGSPFHILSFCPNLVKYRFKNMFPKESFTQFSMVI